MTTTNLTAGHGHPYRNSSQANAAFWTTTDVPRTPGPFDTSAATPVEDLSTSSPG